MKPMDCKELSIDENKKLLFQGLCEFKRVAKHTAKIVRVESSAKDKKANEKKRMKYRIIEKPDWISYDEIAALLHDAHKSTVERGMHFVASYQDGAETERRLGDEGIIMVALSDDNELVGTGSIAFHKSCKDWYGKGRPYGEIKMVGVPEKHKGNGISTALYKSLEKYGFSRCDLLVMNTAKDNRIVLESNARHGWVYVDYKSWKKTDYYSVCMAKWKNGCPYNKTLRGLMFYYRKIYTYAVRKKNGELRFPLNLIRKE